MLRDAYGLVMDPDRNPLSGLPKATRFQLMLVLAYMWTSIFMVWVGQIALIGPSVAVHTVLILGVFFTAEIFRRAHTLSPALASRPVQVRRQRAAKVKQ